tara:strand:+ start:338 stop:2380 length:2043 start_codon:yes stop_codon:yes gene_type:complete
MRRKTKLTWRYAYCITVLICSSLSAFADEEIEFVTETPLKFDNENAESIEYDKDLIDFKPLINNHGSVGLINNKTARFFEESSWSASLYKGSPDTRLNLTLYPYNWLEATLFYSSISGKPYPGYETEDYKDKGFNMKIKLFDEGRFPALAIGLDDFAGTGFYSSEYLVANKQLGKFDIHIGAGWGNLNGDKSFKNPLVQIHDQFLYRPTNFEDQGGQFQPKRYFSDESISFFGGMQYRLSEKLYLKAEYDPTITPGLIGYERAKSNFNFGLDYNIRSNFNVGISFERGNYASFRFSYSNTSSKINKKYKTVDAKRNENEFTHLQKILALNAIGVKELTKSAISIAGGTVNLEVSSSDYFTLQDLEGTINSAISDAGINSEIIKSYKIGGLNAYSDDENHEFSENKLFKDGPIIRNKTSFNVTPFLAAREGFLKLGLIANNDTDIIFSDNLMFNANLKFSLADNFDELSEPPVDTYPAQVRSDVKDYFQAIGDQIVIGRAQFDYLKTTSKSHHIMLSAGLLEDMFAGYGFEYLWFNPKNRYAIGFEAFDVYKRDYEMRFGLQEYSNVTGHLNFYYRNFGAIPFDAKISYGEYLAGDVGGTFEISRSFKNGAKFGVFASFTDVSSTQFGEGSFDKGITFRIPLPLGDNFLNYAWRPLTKDPGQKLNRKNNLHDLLVRFQEIN